MAANARFALLAAHDIEKLAGNASNPNTVRGTKNWLGVYRQWAEVREKSLSLEGYDRRELDAVLSQFYGEVRKQDGTDYEPDSLRVMQSALHRYLMEKKYDGNILKDLEFSQSRKVLEGKARRLRQEGKGKRPNASRALAESEEETLWKAGKLGDGSARSLLCTMWFNNTQHFGLRGVQEHTDMRVENFRFRQDEAGEEFVEFLEDVTKTRQSGLRDCSRVTTAKMFPTGGLRCPVKLFRLFLSKRPEELRNSGRFYLQPKTNAVRDDEVWFTRNPVGKNSISRFMKVLVEGTELEGTAKLTNHSGRKTLVKKLKRAGTAESSIVKVTGHKSVAGLRSYDPGDEDEFRQMSNQISLQRPSPRIGQYLLDSTCGSSSSVQLSAHAHVPSSISLQHPAAHISQSLPKSNELSSSGGVHYTFSGPVTFNNIIKKVQHKRKRVIYESSSSQSSQELFS